MKMKLYYVVKRTEGYYDEPDFDYVAGPFSFETVWEHKNTMQDSYEFDVC